jgi:hypothetical protein
VRRQASKENKGVPKVRLKFRFVTFYEMADKISGKGAKTISMEENTVI